MSKTDGWTILGVVVSIITGWDAIARFLSNVAKNVIIAWQNFPPLIQFLVAIGILYFLLKRNS